MRFSVLMLLLLPFAEIATFVIVGKMIGVLPVLGLTLAAVLAGGFVLRSKGIDTLRRLSTEAREGRDGGRDLVDAAFFVVAGVLLIVPGLLTDAAALLLLVPAVRHFAWRRIQPRVVVARHGFSARSARPSNAAQPEEPPRPGVIDLDPEDFQREDRFR